GGEAASTGAIEPGRDIEDLQARAHAPSRGVRLKLDFQEGEFVIRAGPPGSEIHAEGDFDPRDYELTQETEAGDGIYDHKVTIRFHRKVPLLFFLVKGGFQDGANENKITVTIPEDLPTALSLNLSKGESHVDLGGLDLRELDAQMAMGDHNLRFSRPLQNELQKMELRTGMGDIDLEELGNARAHEVAIRGRMGDMRVDFGGDWPGAFSSRVNLTFGMGDCRVRIPRDVRLSPDSSATAFLGESTMRRELDEGGELPGDAPTVEIHASIRMGDLSVSKE
ncbi:MAG TPA: hypothetical protein VNI57_11995, partial [Candidatus Saccharimonadales bacterium]|nr:hypothetical protein [Candidatus Saccharimonadales bacterium]